MNALEAKKDLDDNRQRQKEVYASLKDGILEELWRRVQEANIHNRPWIEIDGKNFGLSYYQTMLLMTDLENLRFDVRQQKKCLEVGQENTGLVVRWDY